jgi:hypothetical protein
MKIAYSSPCPGYGRGTAFVSKQTSAVQSPRFSSTSTTDNAFESDLLMALSKKTPVRTLKTLASKVPMDRLQQKIVDGISDGSEKGLKLADQLLRLVYLGDTRPDQTGDQRSTLFFQLQQVPAALTLGKLKQAKEGLRAVALSLPELASKLK